MRRFKLRKSASDIDAVVRSNVCRAYRDVPMYRRLGRTSQVRPETVRGVDDLPRLPLVEKNHFVDVPLEDHLRSGVRMRQTRVRVTSGTTGWELDIHMSPAELNFRRFIFLRRIWLSAGRPLSMRVVHAGAWIEPGPPSEIHKSGAGPLRFVQISRHLSLQEQAATLGAERPTVITGCPSALDVIANEMANLDMRWGGPRLIVTRGEILRSQTRRILEQVYQCKVIDFYSAEEIGLIAWQCPENSDIMHIAQDSCVVEIVDAAGQPVPAGTPGDVVITNLFNRTMPFIRYRIGDRSKIVPRSVFNCSCPRVGVSMRSPSGRPDDFIILPSGERISPRVVDDIVTLACFCVGHDSRFYNSIRDYQIVQESLTQIAVHLLTEERVPEEVTQYLEDHVRDIHPNLSARFLRVSEIEIRPSGKRSRVVSLLDMPMPPSS